MSDVVYYILNPLHMQYNYTMPQYNHTRTKWLPFCRGHFQMHFHVKTVVFCLNFHWSLFANGPTDNKTELVRVMAWRRTCDKPLAEPMPHIFINLRLLGDAWMHVPPCATAGLRFNIKSIFLSMGIFIMKKRRVCERLYNGNFYTIKTPFTYSNGLLLLCIQNAGLSNKIGFCLNKLSWQYAKSD